jgi:hypothetical protein
MRALVGLVVLIAAGLLLWRLLPRKGELHSICNTWAEPYALVGVICAASVGIGLIATWASN